jgi:hypothetical protein
VFAESLLSGRSSDLLANRFSRSSRIGPPKKKRPVAQNLRACSFGPAPET